jgi:hypothetical protein
MMKRLPEEPSMLHDENHRYDSSQSNHREPLPPLPTEWAPSVRRIVLLSVAAWAVALGVILLFF